MQLKINLPNLLVVLRILLIPVFLLFFLSGEAGAGENQSFRMLALVVFLIAAVSDFFDGYLARKWKTVSNFGKLMDPLADKMLVSAAMIALAYTQELPAWVVVVIICREFWVTSLRMLALEQGRRVISASLWGKIKTVLQMAMIIVFLADMAMLNRLWIPEILMYLAIITTVLSAVEYTKDYKDVFIA